jgi:cardiolipin synthase
LRDAEENYPAWIAAIKAAEKWVHFETYIIHDDETGRRFAEVLIAKAREGVQVRLIYDWIGSFLNAGRRFWRHLVAGGVDVRCFNPPGFDSPLAWITRDHRKVICVDGVVAYVSGLCVGQRWAGFSDRRIDPWRDTGVEIRGPAVAAIELAFSEVWAELGEPLPWSEVPEPSAPSGEVDVRVVATMPSTAGVYRLDQLIAALAHRSIWLSDAYFIGSSAYVQALRSAAQHGVDVRMLIPSATDVPVARAVARAGLRPLLEAGVRVFEWNGPMMHAKTAVVDGFWARVGSTNLNVTSWLGNWELDVVVEDTGFAKQMEAMFLDDLSRATEIVLRKRRQRPGAKTATKRSMRRHSGATVQKTAAGVIRLSHSLGAAIARQRELGAAESVIMLWGAAILVAFAAVAIIWPKSITYPLAALSLWVTASLLVKAIHLRRRGKRKRADSKEPKPE